MITIEQMTFYNDWRDWFFDPTEEAHLLFLAIHGKEKVDIGSLTIYSLPSYIEFAVYVESCDRIVDGILITSENLTHLFEVPNYKPLNEGDSLTIKLSLTIQGTGPREGG